MPKIYEVEELNYTDTSRLIEAFKDYISKGHSCKYNLDLLLKLERNKRVLYDEPSETADCNTSN